MQRHAFFISDGTGITAETLGLSLITQFADIDFNLSTVPYVDSIESAETAAEQISETYQTQGEKPIVFLTLIDPQLSNIIRQAPAIFIDLFSTFIPVLEKELHIKASGAKGQAHGMHDAEQYHARIDAINFTLNTDDGLNPGYYDDADIILIGVSRTGKTPTSLYLALHYGIKAANYPVTEDDLQREDLPRILMKHKHKCFGLTIDPQRLTKIRNERLNDSNYASLKQCQREVQMTEDLMKEKQIPIINTSTLSVEEIATKIVSQQKLGRKII